MTITRRPPAAGVWGAALAALAGTSALALYSPVGAGIGAVGVVLVVAGLLRPSRRVLGAGAVAIVCAVLAASAFDGAGVGASLAGTVAAAVAWDLGEHALGLGEQLGRETDVTRNVAVHTGASVAVGAVGAGVAFGTYSAATGGQPVVALVFLLVGAVLLASAVR
ncbi:hypothetical protein HUG10_16570 [Halorarum halophilum]|uniref:Uncharacterized protein n=1 Tax=Halorarum halophilum TaxID=2743090 RepID=A0A7D5H2B1_9EURY|nr:hypothetical protein [Halobaculum halophilum]QLG29053.1 hypothetical protein HUG10_16570 [Halobaculum halophilum]